MENHIRAPLSWEVKFSNRTYSYTITEKGLEIVTSDHTADNTISMSWNDVVDYACPISKKGFKSFDYLIRGHFFSRVSKSELTEKRIQRCAIWAFTPFQLNWKTPSITTIYISEDKVELLHMYLSHYVRNTGLRWLKRPLLFLLVVLLGVLMLTAISR